MKLRTLFLALNLLIIAAAPHSEQVIEILVEDTHFPPFKFVGDNQQITGIYPEIVKKAVSNMPGYKIKFVELPWARCKKEIELGNAFAMLPPYFHAHDWLTETEPKRPYIWPYSKPLYTQTDIAVCNEDKLQKPRINWPHDYQDLSFVLQRGDGIAGEEFNRLANQKKIKVTYVDSILNTIQLLMLGRADCTVISKAPFQWLTSEMKTKNEYKKYYKGIKLVQSNVLATNNGYLGYTDIDAEKNFPYKKDFTIKFDIQIYKMRKNGEIDKINEYFTNPRSKPLSSN